MLKSVSLSSLELVQKLSLCRAYNVQTNKANVLTAATEDGFSLTLDPRALQFSRGTESNLRLSWRCQCYAVLAELVLQSEAQHMGRMDLSTCT